MAWSFLFWNIFTHSLINNIPSLMAVWRIRKKIIKTAITVNYICAHIMARSYNLGLGRFSVLCFCKS